MFFFFCKKALQLKLFKLLIYSINHLGNIFRLSCLLVIEVIVEWIMKLFILFLYKMENNLLRQSTYEVHFALSIKWEKSMFLSNNSMRRWAVAIVIVLVISQSIIHRHKGPHNLSSPRQHTTFITGEWVMETHSSLC